MSVNTGADTPLMSIKATGTWEFGFNSAIKLTDLEAKSNGENSDELNTGGVDMAVTALAACTCATIPAVAREMGFRHSGVEFSGKAKFSIDNLCGDGSAESKFESISGTVCVRTDESQERLDCLATEVKNRCRAFDILESAGISPEIEWKKVTPSV